MKIGVLVQECVEKIINFCENDDRKEFKNLQNKEYCRKQFGINYPFFMKTSSISETEHRRYWAKKYNVQNTSVRICNDWYERNREGFVSYLVSKKLITNDEIKKFESSIVRTKKEKAKKANRHTKNTRYRGYAIGNAQNGVIRNILSNLGLESFSKKDWDETKTYFSNQCAYCGVSGRLEMDHAIPMNKTKLGEHRLGNIVPCCASCNNKKNNKSFEEWTLDSKRIRRIETYMKEKKYIPISDSDEEVKDILNKAHAEIRVVAERYIEQLNATLESRK